MKTPLRNFAAFLRTLPVGVKIILLMIPVFLLQASPYTGIFLLLLLAPFWSVTIVNGGMFVLAVEGAFGSVDRRWLSVPIVWFGGYFLAAYLSHSQGADIRLADQDQKMSLMSLQDSGGGVVVTSDELAKLLVSKFSLAAAYAPAGGGEFKAYRVGGRAVCELVESYDRAKQSGVWKVEKYTWTNSNLQGACIYVTSGDTPRPGDVQLQEIERREEGGILEILSSRYRLTGATGKSATFVQTEVNPLLWFPAPVIGCALNSAISDWYCFAKFLREAFHGFGISKPALVNKIARILDLAPRNFENSQATLPDEKAIESLTQRYGSHLNRR